MENWVVTIIVPIAVAVLMNGVGLLLWKSQRGKNRADAAGVITDSSLKMVRQMEERVDELEAKSDKQDVRIEEQDAEIRSLNDRVAVLERVEKDLRHGSDRLVGQIVSLGHEPVWRPNSE